MKINLDSPVLEFLGRAADVMILNLLFILCCAPVITAGPALCALYAVSMRQARHDDGYIVKPYFKAFAGNFRGAFAISCIYCVIGALIAYGFSYWKNGEYPEEIKTVVLAVLCVSAACCILSLLYVFALTARFENGIAATLKNALILAVFNLKETVLLMLIWIGITFLLIFTKAFWVFMAVAGFALMAYMQSVLFVKVFSKYEGEK